MDNAKETPTNSAAKELLVKGQQLSPQRYEKQTASCRRRLQISRNNSKRTVVPHSVTEGENKIPGTAQLIGPPL